MPLFCPFWEKMYHELAKDANFSNNANFTNFLAIRSVSDSEFIYCSNKIKKVKNVNKSFFINVS